MQISLMMLVKDEENMLGECLSPIRDLFDDVVIMDTGSTDRTRELLRDQFGIMDAARDACRGGALERIRVYEFAH